MSRNKEEEQSSSSDKSAVKNVGTICFLHPDLGIGGAERLVVDTAVGLQQRGHKVVIFTSHCDPGHCFDECRDGTLDVRVRGNTIIPPGILSRFSILCAILRQLHLLVQIYLSGELGSLHPAAFFVDQLSAGLPLLRLLYPRGRILFYCHFPDLLLVQGRQNAAKKLYRVPFDTLEQWSMGFAHAIAVNSNFTKGVVSRTWPSLARSKDLKTVYPCVDTKPKNAYPKDESNQEKKDKNGDPLAEIDHKGPLWPDMKFLLSINRFERKKDIALAIRAFAGLSPSARQGVRLVVAGGYDPRVAENVLYHRDLVALAESLGLSTRTASTIVTALETPPDISVLFLLSVPGVLKDALLRSARLLVYTPANEHFGIVPLEAMLVGVPVLAADSGGPTETVLEGQTGWLRSPEKVELWTEVMEDVLCRLSDAALREMSQTGVARVQNEFSDTQMAERLDGIFDEIMTNTEQAGNWSPLYGGAVVLVGASAAILVKVVGWWKKKGD